MSRLDQVHVAGFKSIREQSVELGQAEDGQEPSAKRTEYHANSRADITRLLERVKKLPVVDCSLTPEIAGSTVEQVGVLLHYLSLAEEDELAMRTYAHRESLLRDPGGKETQVLQLYLEYVRFVADSESNPKPQERLQRFLLQATQLSYASRWAQFSHG